MPPSATPTPDALPRLSREALWYAAAASAVVGLAPTAAEAQIVYTDLDPDEFVADGSFFVDFDGDGDAELELNEDDVDNSGNPRDFTRAFRESSIAPDSIAGLVSAIVPFPGGGDYAYPIPLDAGVSIGPNTPNFEDFYTFSFTFTGDDPNGWKGTGEHYIGVRMVLTGAAGTTTHFGWVLIEIPVQGGSMIVKSYAYESTPDTPIATGATVAIEAGPDGTPGTHALSAAAPNPSRDGARFTLEVAAAQSVRVSAYDALGREVAVLHDGALSADRAHAFTLDGAGLPAGVYVVRVVGEAFSDTRTVTIAR